MSISQLILSSLCALLYLATKVSIYLSFVILTLLLFVIFNVKSAVVELLLIVLPSVQLKKNCQEKNILYCVHVVTVLH